MNLENLETAMNNTLKLKSTTLKLKISSNLKPIATTKTAYIIEKSKGQQPLKKIEKS
jgi:hypothetical protein